MPPLNARRCLTSACGAAFTGRLIATSGEGSFADRTVHQLAFGGSVLAGRSRPELFIRLPLAADLGDALDYVLGLGVTFRL